MNKKQRKKLLKNLNILKIVLEIVGTIITIILGIIQILK